VIDRFGFAFEWVELWNEPNGVIDYDFRLDPEWRIYCDMIHMAAHWCRKLGKKVALGGMCPVDLNWLHLMGRREVLAQLDAVGMHGFPGTWEFLDTSWEEKVSGCQAVFEQFGVQPQLWISEAGYSTWRHDERRQVDLLATLARQNVDRVYWYSMYDLHPDRAHQEGLRADLRHYHMGLKTCQDQPKLLYRVWRSGGIEEASRLADRRAPRQHRRQPFLITGGAGFVGTNIAARLAQDGEEVVLFDNLCRPGVEHNVRWLEREFPDRVHLEHGDVRNRYALREVLAQSQGIFHLAAQVAVTSSLEDPMADFCTNLEGTMNLLEEWRALPQPPPLVFASTNKVYGGLEKRAFLEEDRRYRPRDEELWQHGVGEGEPLDFHSPYGCSKGAADQYVRDYARTFGLPAVVLRKSCLYGPHQFGNEDQGWVAHFLLQALAQQPITIYGDGKQVRDLLYVDDVVDAYLRASRQMAAVAGRIFNLGGGPSNSASLLEILQAIEELTGVEPQVTFADWRPGDQVYYVSNTASFQQATGWRPQTCVSEGLARLAAWLREHHPYLGRERVLV
jgi:CDP-paratose 2-epimerase